MFDLRALRRPLLGIMAVAFAAMLAAVLWSLDRSQVDLQQREIVTVGAEVRASIRNWESTTLAELDLLIETAANSRVQSLRSLQDRLRRRSRGVDSLFVWLIPPPSDSDVLINATLIFPERPVADNRARVSRHPCLTRAQELSNSGAEDPVVALAYLEDCAEVFDPSVRLRAATEAARLLDQDGMYTDALVALDSVPAAVQGSLAQGVRLGVPPHRLVTHRTQRAGLLMKLQRQEDALNLVFRAGQELLALESPVDQTGLQYIRWPIMHMLEDAGWSDELAYLEVELARAERRLRAWQEIDERILPRFEEPISEPPRFVLDQYDSERPFLIYYGAAESGKVGVALQLDQDQLLDNFHRGLRPALRESIVVVDTSGRVVSGSSTAGVPLFELPFEQTLAGLRVGVGPGAIAARVDALDNQWRWILTVVLFSTIVTALALWALFRATQQQDRLLLRQREFTTRVTHELKTPLAGIRVMAENVQLGAYRSSEQLENMAGRIIDESDRLTERVNQILHSVRSQQLPRKEPFDPEEAVLEAVDIWGPRLHESSVMLRADLHATPMVLGDSESVRDAVGCLLDNALKYRRDDVESTVELRLEPNGRWVDIIVSDNGIGVPPEMRKDVFERFVRVEGPHRGLAGGHGLGLAQVRSVARGHGGRVSCTEAPGGGACFTMRLPAIR